MVSSAVVGVQFPWTQASRWPLEPQSTRDAPLAMASHGENGGETGRSVGLEAKKSNRTAC